ncbi:MAG: hypothetical protein ALECFALPRED_003409 [Alectoria fallacina]|uniref:Uncharacterized protein n=1 Tax=Alectoria fallacina TaxID=1903189 RepID=A0A8H3FR12_9LECA|nr:MAG: hypothetical protein ALECFALPRED_003409 [Alectoria fallacina]
MSSFVLPRPAPSLPVNETAAHPPPMHSPKDPSKTFSGIISHLHVAHESSSLKLEVPTPSSTRRVSDQSYDVQMLLADPPTPRASVREASKTNSTIMSHCTLPPSNPTSSKPTPRVSQMNPPGAASTPPPRPKHSHRTPSKPPARPPYIPQPSSQTRYVDMLLGLDTIPRSHNLFASFSTWILLAGFIVVPGTFVSVEDSKTLQKGAENSKVEHAVLNTVKHASLIWVAGFCCVIGGAGMVWLWWRWRSNYIWLINKIFLVGLLNSVAGLISTLINVYSQQGGRFSITAKITVGATASCTGITALLYFLYNFWILQGVRKKHQKELELESGKLNTI